MMEQVLRWIEKEKMIQTGDRVVAGVSGGADSVCLLLLLEELREKMGFLLSVVHVEHGIRGAESREDEQFVRKLCRERGIPCRVYSLDVPRLAKERKLGTEETARLLRYQCYREEAERIRREAGGGEACRVKIALAHHADDNAETMLFQMLRGSGIRGLGGMRARRMLDAQTELVRPLLCADRSQIEAYLEEKQQAWRTDSTNTDTDYSRNRLRHVIFPELKQINSQAVMHMNRSAMELQEIACYLSAQAEEIWKQIARADGGGGVFMEERLTAFPVLLQREVIHRALTETAGSSKDIGFVHVEAVLELFSLQVGRRLSLPYGITAVRVYEGICMERRGERVKRPQGELSLRENRSVPDESMPDSGMLNFGMPKFGMEDYEITGEQLCLAEQGETVVLELPDGKISIRVFRFMGEMDKICKKKYTKWLNYDKIKCNLHIRRRRSGDYLTIDAGGHRKKLKAYFVEEKVPRSERGNVWLLTEDSHVLWVIGGRISSYYRIEPDTEKILEVQKIGGWDI